MFVKILDRTEKKRLERELEKDKEANNLLTDTEKLSEGESEYEEGVQYLINEVNRRYRNR
tara:strand:+ start:830 stop:1009 length:180 start_codon:yes stop_codon:yes gene_type:complete